MAQMMATKVLSFNHIINNVEFLNVINEYGNNNILNLESISNLKFKITNFNYVCISINMPYSDILLLMLYLTSLHLSSLNFSSCFELAYFILFMCIKYKLCTSININVFILLCYIAVSNTIDLYFMQLEIISLLTSHFSFSLTCTIHGHSWAVYHNVQCRILINNLSNHDNINE